jgi:hypothetical protein
MIGRALGSGSIGAGGGSESGSGGDDAIAGESGLGNGAFGSADLFYGFWREPRDPNMRRRRLGLGQRRIDDGVHFLLLSTLHKLLSAIREVG